MNNTDFASSFHVLAAPSFHDTVRFPSLPLIINEPNSFLLLSSRPRPREYLDNILLANWLQSEVRHYLPPLQDRKLYQLFVSGSEGDSRGECFSRTPFI